MLAKREDSPSVLSDSGRWGWTTWPNNLAMHSCPKPRILGVAASPAQLSSVLLTNAGMFLGVCAVVAGLCSVVHAKYRSRNQTGCGIRHLKALFAFADM